MLTNVHTRHVISVMLKPKPVPQRDNLHPRTCNLPSWQFFCFASLNGLCPLHSKVKPSRTSTPSSPSQAPLHYVDACIECNNSLESICMSSMIMTGCMATISSSAVYLPLGKAVPISKPTFSCCQS